MGVYGTRFLSVGDANNITWLQRTDGTSTAPWTPADLGASLLAWWDAERSDLITHSAGAVSSWRDIVAGHNLTQATGTAQPIYSATSFAGRAGITPDGVDDYLELAGSPAFLPTGAAPSEDWHLVDQISPAADATLYALGAWGNTSNSNSRTMFRNVVSGVNRLVGNVTNSQNNLLADFSGRHVVRHIVTATGHTPEIDGLAPTEFAVVPATSAVRIRVFANANTTAGNFGKARINTRIITAPLTAPQAAQMYAYLNARLVDADVAAWVAAVVANGGTVSAARRAVVDTLVTAEKAAGTWQLTDDYWLLTAENEQSALTSLKQRRLATAVNTPAFTIDAGYAFDGVSTHIRTGFIPATHAVAMTTTSSRIAVYDRVNANSNNYAAGALSTSNRALRMRHRIGSTTIVADMNCAAATFSLPSADSRGYTAASRNGVDATTCVAYKNGAALTRTIDPAGFGASLGVLELYIGGYNNAGAVGLPRPCTLGLLAVGAALDATQEAAQYANVQAFMTALGANV